MKKKKKKIVNGCHYYFILNDDDDPNTESMYECLFQITTSLSSGLLVEFYLFFFLPKMMR